MGGRWGGREGREGSGKEGREGGRYRKERRKTGKGGGKWERQMGKKEGASPQVLLSASAVSSPMQQKMEPKRMRCSSAIKQVKGDMIQ